MPDWVSNRNNWYGCCCSTHFYNSPPAAAWIEMRGKKKWFWCGSFLLKPQHLYGIIREYFCAFFVKSLKFYNNVVFQSNTCLSKLPLKVIYTIVYAQLAGDYLHYPYPVNWPQYTCEKRYFFFKYFSQNICMMVCNAKKIITKSNKWTAQY